MPPFGCASLVGSAGGRALVGLGLLGMITGCFFAFTLRGLGGRGGFGAFGSFFGFSALGFSALGVSGVVVGFGRFVAFCFFAFCFFAFCFVGFCFVGFCFFAFCFAGAGAGASDCSSIGRCRGVAVGRGSVSPRRHHRRRGTGAGCGGSADSCRRSTMSHTACVSASRFGWFAGAEIGVGSMVGSGSMASSDGGGLAFYGGGEPIVFNHTVVAGNSADGFKGFGVDFYSMTLGVALGDDRHTRDDSILAVNRRFNGGNRFENCS